MFYFYGSKASLAPYFPYPQHDVIVEPFAGAAGYSVHHLVWGRAQEAVLVDADWRVLAMWERLLGMTPDEVLALPPVKAGQRYLDPLIATVMTSNAWGAYGRSGTAPAASKRVARMWPSQLKRIARVLPHLQGRITLIEGDYTQAPDIEATWFVDPPYQKTSAGRKHSGYITSPDHALLSEWTRQRQGFTIACDQKGADWLPFRPLIERMDGVGIKRSEVWWSNQPVELPEADNRLYPGENIYSPTMRKQVAHHV